MIAYLEFLSQQIVFSCQKIANLSLEILVEGGKELWNSYRVIVVNPEKHPKTREKEAKLFAEWIVAPDTQKLIGEFGRDKYGQPLFVPDAVK